MPSRNLLSSFCMKVLLAVVILGVSILGLITWTGLAPQGGKSPFLRWGSERQFISNSVTSPATTSIVPTPTVSRGTETSSWDGSSTIPARLMYLSSASSIAGEHTSRPTGDPSLPNIDISSPQEVAYLALDKVLEDACPIFGEYAPVRIEMSTWMSRYPDSTHLVHMNIPGTHDVATWNYSSATKTALEPITGLVNSTVEIIASHYRCQRKPMIDMLNAGIRAFDLRYAFDVTKSTLVFWHGPGLQSQTATMESVLFGFYKWLQDHRTETILLSFQYEASMAMGNTDSVQVQTELYRILASPAAQKYINPSRDQLGTLGSARGKVLLLRRFDLDKLPADRQATIPGLHFSPQNWTVNGAEIHLAYSNSSRTGQESGTAYIQDYYSPLTATNSSLADNVEAKMEALLSHFTRAASANLRFRDSLFWGFASSTNIGHALPLTPGMLALGSESTVGVNHRLLEVLSHPDMQGKRLGMVMFDFFEEPKELVEVFLGLLPPTAG